MHVCLKHSIPRSTHPQKTATNNRHVHVWFQQYIYHDLRIYWASYVLGFMALACVLIPFIFYRYGERLRKKSGFAAEAVKYMRELEQQ